MPWTSGRFLEFQGLPVELQQPGIGALGDGAPRARLPAEEWVSNLLLLRTLARQPGWLSSDSLHLSRA